MAPVYATATLANDSDDDSEGESRANVKGAQAMRRKRMLAFTMVGVGTVLAAAGVSAGIFEGFGDDDGVGYRTSPSLPGVGNASFDVSHTCSTYRCGPYKPGQACQCNDECGAHNSCCGDFKKVCSKSCAEAGCGQYVPSRLCQCNADCEKYGSCCGDFKAVCQASCAKFGCVPYNPKQPCQCNAACSQHNSCCGDFSKVCGAAAQPTHRPPSASPQFSGSCAAFGCGSYAEGRSCQCDVDCAKHKRCCQDFASSCAAPSSKGLATCAIFGCGTYDAARPCQCNDACEKYGSCCGDFNAVCQASCKKFGCAPYDASKPCQCNDACKAHNSCCSDFEATCKNHAPKEITTAGPLCASLGCDVQYDASRSCQCNDQCNRYKNCCKDYQRKCASPQVTTVAPNVFAPAPGPSCAKLGCGVGYSSSRPCQCNAKCGSYGNCCHDYEATCRSTTSAPHHAMVFTCEALGCGKKVEGNVCQCDGNCAARGSCCVDFYANCAASLGVNQSLST